MKRRYNITSEPAWAVVNAITIASRLSTAVTFSIHGNTLWMHVDGNETLRKQCHSIVSDYFCDVGN